MATFKFDHDIDIHWNGYDIVGPAETVFSIPDQLYEEFESDLRSVEPSLTWIDTNEFLTLSNSVSAATLSATFPIALTTSTTGKTISLSSSTNPNGYLLSADGSGGVIFTPASTSGLTSVVGVSPISTAIAGGTVSVILDASYQTAGTYVNAVIGTSPASVVTASGTSTVSIDQAAITGATAATNAQTVRTYVKNTTGTTITKGSAVYISGATGDNALISLSTASTEAGSSKTLGITAESIDTDAFGYVVESGYLTGIDTTGVTAGSSIWLGNTPGSLVFGAPPAEPSHSVYLGVVIREQQNNGSILVKVQNGYELDELHDVSAGSPIDLDILQYKSSSALWTKASIANAGIAASVHTHDYQASGTYVNAVIGTSPASVSTASGTSTVSIVSGSINSTHLSATSVGSSQLIDQSVTTGKIGSGDAALNTVLTASGTGAASFLPLSIAGSTVSSFTSSGTYTVPTDAKLVYVYAVGGGGAGGNGTRGAIGRGGSGGGVSWRYFRAVDLSSSTYAITIGAGGIGISGTSGAGNGSNASAGGATTFGTNLLTAARGLGAKSNGAADPAVSRLSLVSTEGSAAGVDGSSNNDALYGPGTGGNGASSTDTAGISGGSGFAKFAGGTNNGGAGGTAGTASVAGGAGQTGGFGDGAGGGGASSLQSANGGAGGVGAFPGGGGGGGARASATGSTGVGGSGGNGGDGWCLVIAI